jgi:hypothetical protein
MFNEHYISLVCANADPFNMVRTGSYWFALTAFLLYMEAGQESKALPTIIPTSLNGATPDIRDVHEK